jgi:hypothetical protein
MAGWSEAEIEGERLSEKRFGDRKLIFVYGL